MCVTVFGAIRRGITSASVRRPAGCAHGVRELKTDCEYHPVDPDYLDRQSDRDAVLVCQITSMPLRRLVRHALGLSEESMDLLTAVTDRLRTAEGALADPATAGEW